MTRQAKTSQHITTQQKIRQNSRGQDKTKQTRQDKITEDKTRYNKQDKARQSQAKIRNSKTGKTTEQAKPSQDKSKQDETIQNKTRATDSLLLFFCHTRLRNLHRKVPVFCFFAACLVLSFLVFCCLALS
jgi:hypothetical protein